MNVINKLFFCLLCCPCISGVCEGRSTLWRAVLFASCSPLWRFSSVPRVERSLSFPYSSPLPAHPRLTCASCVSKWTYHRALSTWDFWGGRLAGGSTLSSPPALRFKPSFLCRLLTMLAFAKSLIVIVGVADISAFIKDSPCRRVFAVWWPETFFSGEGEHVTLHLKPSQHPRSLSKDLLLPWWERLIQSPFSRQRTLKPRRPLCPPHNALMVTEENSPIDDLSKMQQMDKWSIWIMKFLVWQCPWLVTTWPKLDFTETLCLDYNIRILQPGIQCDLKATNWLTVRPNLPELLCLAFTKTENSPKLLWPEASQVGTTTSGLTWGGSIIPLTKQSRWCWMFTTKQRRVAVWTWLWDSPWLQNVILGSHTPGWGTQHFMKSLSYSVFAILWTETGMVCISQRLVNCVEGIETNSLA